MLSVGDARPFARALPLTLLTVVVLLAATLLGAMAVVFPAWFLVAVLTVPWFLLISWRFPEFAVAFALLVGSGLVPPHLVPTLPLLGGRIHGNDVFVMLITAIAFAKHVALSRETPRAFWRYLWPITYLAALASVSLVVAFVVEGNPARNILAEGRPLLHWALLPVLILTLDTRERAYRFAKLLGILGGLVACGLALQSATGIQIIYGGRLETAETLGTYYEGVLRSTTPGIYFVIFAILFVTSMAAAGMLRAWIAAVCLVVLGIGLVSTFGRTLWGATAFGLFVLVGLLGVRRGGRVIAVGTAAAAMLFVGGLLAKPDLLDAVMDRVTSVSAEFQVGRSLEWRSVENSFAINRLVKNPLWGVGLGGDYKPVVAIDRDPEQARKIHNGYLYLMLKLGVGSLLFLVWFYALVARDLASLLRRGGRSHEQGFFRAAAAVAFLPLITAFTRAEWMESGTIMFLAALIGTVGAFVSVVHVNRPKESAATRPSPHSPENSSSSSHSIA